MVRSQPLCESMNLALISLHDLRPGSCCRGRRYAGHPRRHAIQAHRFWPLPAGHLRACNAIAFGHVAGGAGVLDMCTTSFTGRFQGHGPGRVWAAITSGIRRGIQAAGPGIERGAGRGSVSCGGRGRVRLALCTLSRRRFHTRLLLSIGAGRSAMQSSRRSCGTSMGAGRGVEVPRGDKKLTSAQPRSRRHSLARRARPSGRPRP